MRWKVGRSVFLLGLLVAAVVALSSPSAAGGNHRVFVSNCGKTAFRPHTIVVFCGDAGVIVDRIHWRHWGFRAARGRGTAHTKTCNPDCASGGVRTDRVKVRLSHRHMCRNGKRYFLRINVRYPAGNVLHHSLGCP